MPDGSIHADLAAALPQLASSSDAALLAIGALFDAANEREQAASVPAEGADEEDLRSAVLDALDDATGVLVDRIIDLPATSLEGLLIKTRALRWARTGGEAGPEIFGYFPGIPDLPQGPGSTDERLVIALLADLYRIAGFPVGDVSFGAGAAA